MSETSPLLVLPYIQPSQAQKHVTHNEAVQQLDALVQLSVIELEAVTPPASPAPGDRYGLGTGATGAWAGHDGEIALWTDTAWIFLVPRTGWLVWDQTAGALMVHAGGGWTYPSFAQLGVNATPDAINRLAVSSDATLLTHDGDDHQLKLNKATATDTGTLLYQTNWTGHAEMGLSGSNDWSIKVSPDGSSWTEALKIDQTSGHATGAAVQSAADDTTPGRLMRADYGYGPGNLIGTVSQVSGTPTGAVVERGANANGEYVRYADGTQICWRTRTSNLASTTAYFGGYRTASAGAVHAAEFSSPPVATATVLNQTAFAVEITSISSTSTVVRWLTVASDAAATREAGIIAIGRWF